MKFKITKAALLDGLQVVQNVVGARSTLPILANVHIKAERDKIALTTTDLDVSVQCSVEAEVAKGGGTTMPVRRLASIVRELPDTQIEFDIDDKDIATVKCGSSFFKIIGISQEEFPPMPKGEGKHSYHVQQNVFKEMLRMTHYAASSDETRYVLNGVLLSFRDGKLTLVATDGRRLALVEHEVEFPAEAGADMILPTKAVAELQHTLKDEGELRIQTRETQVMFEYGNVQMFSKLIDGAYPNYRQVIPAQCQQHIAVERETLLTALRRVSLLMTEKANATKLTFGDNKIALLMSSPDVGEAQETVPIKYSGEPISVAFNPEYMMDPLKNLTSDEVFIELTDDLSPGVIKCDIPFLYVLMPMRIT